MSDLKNRWVSAEIPDDTYRALVMTATELGVHPSKLIGQYIISKLQEEVEVNGEHLPIDVHIWAVAEESKRNQRMRSQLVSIAYQHTQDPTEESSDMLNTLCIMAGVEIQQILDEAQDSRVVPLIQDGGTKQAEAMEWLGELLKSGGGQPAKAIFAKGEELGYSQSLLKQAKSALGIISKRKPDCWVWEWEDDGSVIVKLAKK
jgi:hypothetical protein